MKYLNLDRMKGSFYEYSKEEKEGFEKHVSTKGNESFRKYYDYGVEGVLESVGLYDGYNGNQEISINVLKDGESHACKLSLKDQKGFVDSDFAEDVIKVLTVLKKGMNLSVNPYCFKPDGSKYDKRGISFKSDGVKLERTLSNSYYKDGKLVDGDIPAIKWNKRKDKNELDLVSAAIKSQYLLDYFDNNISHLKFDGTPSPKEVEVKEKTDDLPF